MTTLLQKAFDEAQGLPDDEQDAIAERILEEIEDDRKWEESLARSGHILDQWIADVRKEIDAGLTRPVECDED